METHNCPWIIEDRAARDLLRITGRTDAEFVDAMSELREYARDVVDRDATARELPSGCVQYRSGRPLRARLIVEPGEPQRLIEVRPDHEGRGAPYTRSRDGWHSVQSLDLRQLREKLGVSQSALAEAMGLTQGALSKVEASDDPSLRYLLAAVEALGGRLDVTAKFRDPERIYTLKFPGKSRTSGKR